MIGTKLRPLHVILHPHYKIEVARTISPISWSYIWWCLARFACSPI